MQKKLPFLDHVVLGHSAKQPAHVLQLIAQTLGDISQTNSQRIYSRLMDKEVDQTSGIGGGVAIPHARFLNLERPVGMLITLKSKLDFGAADGKAVDLIYTILSPRSEWTEHLQHLSAATRFLKDTDICAHIRHAQDSDLLQSMLNNPDGWTLAA